jgi:hypothetical protein
MLDLCPICHRNEKVCFTCGLSQCQEAAFRLNCAEELQRTKPKTKRCADAWAQYRLTLERVEESFSCGATNHDGSRCLLDCGHGAPHKFRYACAECGDDCSGECTTGNRPAG